MNAPRILPGARACLSLLILLAVASHAFSAQLSFTHSASGSGSIGGVPFTNASFSIFELVDTGNRVPFTVGGTFGYSIIDTSASINIAGLGLFHFTTPTRTFVNNDIGIVGFARGDGDLSDLFDGPGSSVFATWNMLTPIGPITANSGELTQWSFSPVTTDGGVLVFNNARPINATFQATLVPEPSSVVLLLGAMVWVGFRQRR
jgi:hypothetical protein